MNKKATAMRGVRVKLPAGVRSETLPRRASSDARVIAKPVVATPITYHDNSAPIWAT